MSEIAELLRSLAPILWPVLVYCALRTFRDDVSGAIGRIKRATLPGTEIEMHPQTEELHELVSQATSKVADLPRDTVEVEELTVAARFQSTGDEVIHKILETATRSPTAALLLLAAEMEKEARDVLASIGKLTERRPPPFLQVIKRLDSHYGLPVYIHSSIKLFQQIKSKLVHGRFANDRDIWSVLDSGMDIYRALRALPRERHWVHHEGVPVYSDEKCLHELQGVRGVIIKSESSSGTRTIYRIFPSTQTHFKKGNRVSWEWNLDNTWLDAWYRDPDSNRIKSAWSASGEFVGRHFEEW